MMPAALKALFGAGRPAKRLAKRKGKSSFSARLVRAGDKLAFAWPIREGLYRHLSAQVSNGVNVEKALETFSERLKRRKKVSSEKIVADVARRMRDGATLADALGRWIPQDEASIISSGELAGNLPKALDLVVEAKRRVGRVNGAIRKALTTPAIYLAMLFAMMWMLGRFVLPGFKTSLPPERARGLISGLYTMGDFANSWWSLLPFLLLVAIVAVVMNSFTKWTGRHRVTAERYFPYSFYRDIQGYTWLMSFAALLRAGMADVAILKRQAAEAKKTSPWLYERAFALWWRMDNGASLPDSLLTKGRGGMPPFAFPNPDIIDDIASMSDFGDFPERIAVVAVQWADELESSTMGKAAFLGTTMEVLMFVLMGMLMVAINSMSTQIGNVPGM
jgi:type II secretory pathway component PulF